MTTLAHEAGRRPLILIVEDDPGTRALYKDCLTQSGFNILEAHNGFQALEKAQQRRPEAIVTDIAVPGMDGFQFARALRASPWTSAIPILAVTGHTEYLDEPDRLRTAGIAHVLLKPCAPDVVVEAVRQLLERR